MKPYYRNNTIEAGCDEAGRGCLAGPVVAAAVILPPGFDLPGLNDSKKTSEQQRNTLRRQIEQTAVSWGVAMVDNHTIDRLNILRASVLAMHRALDKLQQRPEWLLIDGNRFFRYHAIPHLCVVKGDSKYASIAAASILAKTHRDEYMLCLHKEFPAYQWQQNKGYPTKTHRRAIAESGISPYHRRSFKLYEQQLDLPF